MGTWVARIPDIQARAGLTDGQLGFAMLGLSLGALTGSLLAGWLLAKLSTGQSAILSAMFFGASIALPAFAVNFWSLFSALLTVGLSNGFMNISINAAAAAIEREYQVRIMLACHGMFSLGGIAGAATSGWIAGLGVPLAWHFTTMALLMMALQMTLRPILLTLPNNEIAGARLALPRRPLLILIIITFCVILCEGAIADWSAIYLKKNLNSSAFVAGLGYAGFCLTMALGRFSGDLIRARWGTRRTVSLGTLIGAGGLILLVLTTHPLAGVLCFVLIGAGMSTVVPSLYSASVKAPGVSPNIGLASVATAGVFGLFVGRLLVGNLSDAFGLNIALAALALLLLWAASLMKRVHFL